MTGDLPEVGIQTGRIKESNRTGSSSSRMAMSLLKVSLSKCSCFLTRLTLLVTISALRSNESRSWSPRTTESSFTLNLQQIVPSVWIKVLVNFSYPSTQWAAVMRCLLVIKLAPQWNSPCLPRPANQGNSWILVSFPPTTRIFLLLIPHSA